MTGATIVEEKDIYEHIIDLKESVARVDQKLTDHLKFAAWIAAGISGAVAIIAQIIFGVGGL